MRAVRTALTLALATTLALMAAPTAVAGPLSEVWWATEEACDPAREILHDHDVTDDGDTNWTHQRYEYDPLKEHSCGEFRDDVQEEVYGETSGVAPIPSYWHCDSTFTPWQTCVGFQLDGCDLWVSHLSWMCFGGIFPHDE